jgi:hypothetical protein
MLTAAPGRHDAETQEDEEVPMSIGPVEIVVIEFSDDWTPGGAREQIRKLVEEGVVRIVDALLAVKARDGTVVVVEVQDTEDDLASLLGELSHQVDLVSDEDVTSLMEAVEPGRRVAVIAFEHTWIVPVRDAVVASGGTVIGDLHIPGAVVDDVLAAAGQS